MINSNIKPLATDYFDFSTLVELLVKRAEAAPNQLAYRFLAHEDDKAPELLYCAELELKARTIGTLLQKAGLQGQRAILLFPPGLDFVTAFFGCLYAGVVAVPVYPPNPARLERTLPRLLSIIDDSQPAVALTTSEILPMIEYLFAQEDKYKGIQWFATDKLDTKQAAQWEEPEIDSKTVAFLQYTSGSTGTPRGVVLTHANLLHNLSLIYNYFDHSSQSEGVIWLPSYHDMGLIGGILQPIYASFPVSLMSPMTFLKKPYRWLKAISDYKATTSGGPNFAYDLCVRRVTAEQRATLDLSSWKVAFNGAEPVRPETIERFSRIFAETGFRKEAFYPCYGLAEGTLIVSGIACEALPRYFPVQKTRLEQNIIARTEPEDQDTATLVGCGRAILEQRIVIAHPETFEPCAADQVGEIWVAGPSIASGYWNREAETAQTFQARLANGEGPFLRTGDLGFIHEGELFVTGRLKDLIIIRGRNCYPHDIEWTVEHSHKGIRPGCSAAFSVDIEGEERLVVVTEYEPGKEELAVSPVKIEVAEEAKSEDSTKAIKNVRQAISEQHQLSAYAIVLIKSGSIPKTSSGKIQRQVCKANFLAGDFDVIASNRAHMAI